MNHVLVISGHTDLATSVANKAIFEAIDQQIRLCHRHAEKLCMLLDKLEPAQ